MTGTLESEMARRWVSGADGPSPPEPAGLGGEPLWLTGGRWPLFAWLHEPDGDALGAVVLCPPLLGEHLSAQGAHRLVARSLADQGLLAVRFDYEGTGDSGGPSGGPGRPAAWLDGVNQAAAMAQRRCRGPLALVGVRSGALIAANAAVRRQDVDALVLWDPWQSGRMFLRRQRALQALRLQEPNAALRDLEVPGFALDPATAEAIQGLRLPGSLPVRRALQVARPPAPAERLSLAVRGGSGSLNRTSAEVICAVEGEQEACFEVDPLRRQVPMSTAALVVDWLTATLRELDGDGSRRTAVAPAVGAAVTPEPGAPEPESAFVPITIAPAVPGDATVVERALVLGPHGLFAIETAPGGAQGDPSTASLAAVSPPAGSLPAVVFLSSGTDSHVGPSRLWVTLARRLAAGGIRCIRVDLSGLGDSPTRPGHTEGVIRAPEAFDDVIEVVNALGRSRDLVLAGLCSGAYQALESALELRPRGVVGVNPMLRFTPPEMAAGGPVSPRRRLCQPRPAWVAGARRVLPQPVGRAMATARRLVTAPRSAHGERAGWIDELAAAAVAVYCVCGEDEARQLADFGLTGGASEDMRVDVLPGLDHGLGVAAHRDDVAGRVVDAVRRMCGLADGPVEGTERTVVMQGTMVREGGAQWHE